jgi:hypothetical protein
MEGAISVRFKPPGQEAGTVSYSADDSPLVGIPVATERMWYKQGPSASEPVTMHVEGW